MRPNRLTAPMLALALLPLTGCLDQPDQLPPAVVEHNEPAPRRNASVAITSAGATHAANDDGTPTWFKNYTIASAHNLTYGDLVIFLGGARALLDLDGTCDTTTLSPDSWIACGGNAERDPTHPLTSGDSLRFRFSTDPTHKGLGISDRHPDNRLVTLKIR